jgi:hypothetical protein
MVSSSVIVTSTSSQVRPYSLRHFPMRGTALSPITLHWVDVDAVRAADRCVLVGYAAAVAENARDLLADAEFLLAAGRWARAHSLALLASEEWAKAYAVLTLSFMPPAVRARVPVRDFL